jgi:hypothetical protein
MRSSFLLIGAALTLLSVYPYARDVRRGITRPHLVSWSTWTLLTAIATAAQISAGEYIAAIFTASATLQSTVILMLGLRHGSAAYRPFDALCQLGALVGLGGWLLLDSPAFGVVACVATDVIGALPTVKHCWREPTEETWALYAVNGVGGVCAIAALPQYNWISLTYAVYTVLASSILVATLLWRRRVARPRAEDDPTADSLQPSTVSD